MASTKFPNNLFLLKWVLARCVSGVIVNSDRSSLRDDVLLYTHDHDDDDDHDYAFLLSLR